MKRIVVSAGLLVSFVPASAWAVLPAPGGPAPALYRSGEVLVKYRDSAPAAAVSAFKGSFGLETKSTLTKNRLELVHLPSVTDVPAAIAAMAADSTVEYVEPNFIRRPSSVTPNDPLFNMQWGLYNTGQANFVAGGPAGTPGGDINAINAWDLSGDGVADHTGTGSVIIAIVDDAVETGHPDLAANIVAGYNFVDNNNDPTPKPTSSDAQKHGTSVAGCAAAVGNNGIGVSGSAWNEKIMPIKFGFDVASEVQAFQYAIDHGAKVVNASFGGPSYSTSEYNAINALNSAGIVLVTAAGNENSNTDFAGASFPANYQLPNVIPVAATNRQDGIASFSTYGPVTVPIAAAGLQIVTTTTGGNYTTNGISGTSFASPYVAGVAALIRDYIPTATVSEVKARLIESAVAGVNTSSPANQRTAGGRINAATALSLSARPNIIIQPVQTSTYQVSYSSGPVTVPVYSPVTVEDGGNGVLDPGETANIRVTLTNLWQAANLVTATLTANGGGVTVNNPNVPVSFGNLATNGTASGVFSVTVPSTVTGHQYVDFTVNISAGLGSYTASRHFTLEIGRLQSGVPVTQTIQTDIYDEFHTWHIDIGTLPAGTNTLTFTTTGTSNDLDIIVRYAQPAQYEISLSADQSSDPSAFYFYNVPMAQVGGAPGGNETVTINNPQSGTYFVTVVNYDQTSNAQYTLAATLTNTPPSTASPGPSSGGGGGGGAASPFTLAALLIGLRQRGRKARVVQNRGKPEM